MKVFIAALSLCMIGMESSTLPKLEGMAANSTSPSELIKTNAEKDGMEFDWMRFSLRRSSGNGKNELLSQSVLTFTSFCLDYFILQHASFNGSCENRNWFLIVTNMFQLLIVYCVDYLFYLFRTRTIIGQMEAKMSHILGDIDELKNATYTNEMVSSFILLLLIVYYTYISFYMYKFVHYI